MHRTAIVLTMICASLVVFATPAHAAPPPTGSVQPVAGSSHAIPSDYVGLAQVGPRSYCEVQQNADGTTGPALCVDTTRAYTRMWVRSGTRKWRPGRLISNRAPDYFFVTPYAKGWHWVVSLRYGVFVLPTRSLSLMSPSHF